HHLTADAGGCRLLCPDAHAEEEHPNQGEACQPAVHTFPPLLAALCAPHRKQSNNFPARAGFDIAKQVACDEAVKRYGHTRKSALSKALDGQYARCAYCEVRNADA